MRKNFILFFLMMYLFNLSAFATSGKKVFETYCWGCHHQTAMAFGPQFQEIASKRNADEIKAMITDPKSVSKIFGYRRNAMPAFRLSDENLTAITQYILSFKLDSNSSSDINQTIIEKPYSNIASKGAK
jgi:mono/diheme cytochrome c family protein